jgi:hypothetical protein
MEEMTDREWLEHDIEMVIGEIQELEEELKSKNIINKTNRRK